MHPVLRLALPLVLLVACAEAPPPIAPAADAAAGGDPDGGGDDAAAGDGAGTSAGTGGGTGGTGGGTSAGTGGGTGGTGGTSGDAGTGGGTGGEPDQDYFEGWPATDFFTRYCGDCHPHLTNNGWDWQRYDHVVEQYDHIYCGVGLDEVPECGGHHQPGHLPQGNGPRPTTEERERLIAWMDAGMPRLADLQ